MMSSLILRTHFSTSCHLRFVIYQMCGLLVPQDWEPFKIFSYNSCYISTFVQCACLFTVLNIFLWLFMQRKTDAFKLLVVKNFNAGFFFFQDLDPCTLSSINLLQHRTLNIKCSPVLCHHTVSAYLKYGILYLEQKKVWLTKNVIKILCLNVVLFLV